MEAFAQWLGSAAQVVDHRAGGVERVAVVLERAAMPSLTLGNGLFELRKVLLSKLDKRTPGLDQQTRRDLRRGASARAGSVPQRLRRSLVATDCPPPSAPPMAHPPILAVRASARGTHVLPARRICSHGREPWRRRRTPAAGWARQERERWRLRAAS